MDGIEFKGKIKEMLQKAIAFAQDEIIDLLFIQHKPSDGQISTPNYDRCLMSTTQTASVRDCVQVKVMRWCDRNMSSSENDEKESITFVVMLQIRNSRPSER